MGSTSRMGWTTSSRTGLGAIVCAALVLGACGSKESAVADSAKPTGAAQPATAGAASNQGAATDPEAASYTPLGTLPQPIEWMIQHPDDFKALVDPPGMYTGNFANRDCVGCGSNKTKVHVGAISDAWRVDFKSLPLRGVIMARMENFGSYTEEKYRIPKKETWYVLWGGDGSSDAHMRLVRRVDSPGHTTQFSLVEGWLTKVTDCGHPRKYKPDADFTDCELKRGAESKGGGAILSASKGVWLSCTQGCCTADAAPLDLEKYHAISDSIAGRKVSAKDSTKT